MLANQRLIGGRYAVERELGRGAQGRVLLALDRDQGDAPRAIKLVSPRYEAQLRWEFDLLQRTAHPNLAVTQRCRIFHSRVQAQCRLRGTAIVVLLEGKFLLGALQLPDAETHENRQERQRGERGPETGAKTQCAHAQCHP